MINTEKKKADSVTMIKVTGMTYEEAKSELYKLGLGIRNAGTQASDTYEEGQVMSQDVEEGSSVDVNTTINVYISSGAGAVTVPNVVGYDSDAAMNTLTDQGFSPKRDYAYSDTVASGKVISQTPDANASAKKGDTVTLVVSQGKEAVTVPDVYNRTQEEATSMLTQAGLVVSSTTSENSDTVEAGKVISQSVAAGKYVEKGSGVTLVISLGSKKNYYSCKATVTAPDNDDVVSADISLKGSNGTTIQSWSGIKISKFPYTISASDIEEIDSGTIRIVWYLSDGSSKEQTENVMFTKQ